MLLESSSIPGPAQTQHLSSWQTAVCSKARQHRSGNTHRTRSLRHTICILLRCAIAARHANLQRGVSPSLGRHTHNAQRPPRKHPQLPGHLVLIMAESTLVVCSRCRVQIDTGYCNRRPALQRATCSHGRTHARHHVATSHPCSSLSSGPSAYLSPLTKALPFASRQLSFLKHTSWRTRMHIRPRTKHEILHLKGRCWKQNSTQMGPRWSQ